MRTHPGHDVGEAFSGPLDLPAPEVQQCPLGGCRTVGAQEIVAGLGVVVLVHEAPHLDRRLGRGRHMAMPLRRSATPERVRRYRHMP